MAIERLTAEDLVMLWPDAIWPQDIGALAILDGTHLLGADGRFRIDVVKEAVTSRLHLVPRFRQVLHVPDRRLGPPLWVDDPAFDLSRHVGQMELHPPGDEMQLLLATEELRSRRLDRSRPLWEMWFMTGMPGGQVGMFVRTHHSIADGIAGVATLASFLDVSPDTIAAPPESWIPARVPSDANLLADEAQRVGQKRRQLLSRVAHPVSTARHTLAVLPAIRELLAEPGLPATSLDQAVGAARTFGLVRSRLDIVKGIAHANDAKVNDVLLTVIAGGLRALLRARGEAVDGMVMRIYAPVSLRHGQYAGARGNLVAEMVVPLPVGLSDPLQRLHQITLETIRRKARARPSVGALPFKGIVGRAALKLIERQRVNVESADLPGPPMPLYLAGMRMLEVFPLLPLIGRVSLGVGALSYAEQFNIGIVADGEGYPDLNVLAAGVEDDLRALEGSLEPSGIVA